MARREALRSEAYGRILDNIDVILDRAHVLHVGRVAVLWQLGGRERPLRGIVLNIFF